MRLMAITPIHVTDAELERRRVRYARLSPSGVDVGLFNLPGHAGVPRALETAADVAASSRLVAEAALACDPSEWDALMPDCVLDPGIDRLERAAAVPVFGMLRLCAGFLAACGRRFAAVTRNRAIGDELVERIRHEGLEPAFVRLVVLDLDFAAIADDAAWGAALAGAEDEAAEAGAGALINGCSAVELRGAARIPTLDPTRLALDLVGSATRAGLAAPVPR